MTYYRFTRLQQYINGQPTDTYTKGERVDDVDYSTYETCMGGSGNSRWISIPQTVCYNGDLWSMEKEQISYDGGQTWVDTTNTRRAAVIEPSASQCSGADNDWRVVYGEYICNGTTKCLKEAEYIGNSPTGRTRAGSIVELLSEDCGVMYQWVNVPGEYVCVFKCGRGDKYTKQKQQYSLDNGVHWEDTGETREGDFVEKNSSYCGCDTSVTRWVTVSGEYVCVGTSKYTKEKEQTSTDGNTWEDTGNTRAGSLIEASSSSCASTRWVTVSGQYSCVGTDKYNLEKEQSSTDGEHWTDTGNTRTGSTLIEANSLDCGYTPPSTTRWVADTGYVCVGRDKYNKEKEQISYDSGNTWSDTGATRTGSTLIEADSEDCLPKNYERIVNPLGMTVSTAPCEDVSLWPADDYYETGSLVHKVVNYEDNGIRYNIYTHHHFTTTGDSQIIRYNNPENGDCFKVTVFQDSGSYASIKRTVRQELIGHVCVADNNDVLFFNGYTIETNMDNLKADFECEPTMNPSLYYDDAHFYNFSKDIDIKFEPTGYLLWKFVATNGHTFDLYYRERVNSDNFIYQFTIDSTDMSVYNKFQSN